MSKRTCVLKSKECPNEEKCIKNILSHLKCLKQKRKGLKKIVSFLTKEIANYIIIMFIIIMIKMKNFKT